MTSGRVEPVTILVDGMRYGGIVSGRVTRALTDPVGDFSFDFVDRWTEAGERWPIRPGNHIQVLASDDTLIEGYIDSVDLQRGDGKLIMRAAGRSLLGDLADCQVESQGRRSLAGMTPAAAISRLVHPYAIPLDFEPCPELARRPLRRFGYRREERVLEVIQRICRARGVFPFERGAALTFVAPRPADPVALLSEGQVLTIRRVEDHSSRFSHYHWIKSDRPAPRRRRTESGGTLDADPAPSAPVRGTLAIGDEAGKTGASPSYSWFEVIDAAIDRYRPLRIRKRGAARSIETAARREAHIRAGRSERVEITTAGFRADTDDLYEPGQSVTVDEPILRVGGDFIADSVEYEWGPGVGQLSTLTLLPPAAFSTDAYPMLDPNAHLGDTLSQPRRYRRSRR